MSWGCFKDSDTFDDTNHRVALAGAVFFALFGAIAFLRQMSGFPRLILTPEGFTQRTWFAKKEFAWSRLGDPSVGPSFLGVSSISFIDRETGFKESVSNFAKVS